MKILQINQCHYRRGGADSVYLNTIDLLESKGHSVASFSTQNVLNENTPYSKYYIPDVDLRSQSYRKKIAGIKPYLFNDQAHSELEKIVEDFKPEVAHVHLFYASLSVSVLQVLYKFNIPVLHTVHDYRLLCPVNNFMDNSGEICEACAKGSSLNCFYKKCSEGKISQSAAVTLESLYWKYFNDPKKYIHNYHFVSKFCMDKHLQYFPHLKKQSTVFYNFTSLEISEQAKINNSKYYLYFGRLATEKGIKTLINTWSGLPPKMNLKIIGGGPMFEYLRREILQKNYTNIDLLGYKSGPELNDLIKGAHFVIVPSEWYENNPMTIVESYSLGKPVIGSNIGGIPEIIVENETGFVFEPGNTAQLHKMILKADNLSETEYIDFSERALKFAKYHFSKEIYYKHLLKSYMQTINLSKNH